MTGTRRHREWSSGLLYFLAGSIASTGINIITSLATSEDRGYSALLLFGSSLGFLTTGYVLSIAGEIAADFEEKKAAHRLYELTNGEQAEILDELGVQRLTLLNRLRWPTILSSVVSVVPIIAREAILHPIW